MGARQRLNSLYLTMALGTAIFIGGWFESWVVFLLVAIIFSLLLTLSGDIRPSPTRSSQRPPRVPRFRRKR